MMYIDFMFEDTYTGENFFVELLDGATLEDAIAVLEEYGFLEEMYTFVTIVSESEAEILGYDTY